MLKTRITELFGIQYPIIQGAMGHISYAELVAAVSNAGGLGTLVSGTFYSDEELRREVRKVKSLTDKPFAVNFSLNPTVHPVNIGDRIEMVAAEGVKIVETSGRSPEPYMERLKRHGLKVMHKVAGPRYAVTAERVGADAVAVVGFEGGGHPGMDDVSTLVRIPMTVDAVKVPVVAAGGIGDARGFVAALALGAEGVLMGTRFMCTKECPIPQTIKESMVKARETDTMIIQRSIRDAHRVLKTPTTYQVLGMEARDATLEALLTLIGGVSTKKMLESGDLNLGVLACGQVVGLIDSVPTCKEVIDSIVRGAQALYQRWDRQKLF